MVYYILHFFQQIRNLGHFLLVFIMRDNYCPCLHNSSRSSVWAIVQITDYPGTWPWLISRPLIKGYLPRCIFWCCFSWRSPGGSCSSGRIRSRFWPSSWPCGWWGSWGGWRRWPGSRLRRSRVVIFWWHSAIV